MNSVKRFSRARRKGSIYLVVLGTSFLVAALAMASISVGRIERKANRAELDVTEARLYADAAIQIGLLQVKKDSQWRTNRLNGVWDADRAVGRGTYTLEGLDPVDANFSNVSTDPLVLVGTGACGAARHKVQVTLLQDPLALPALGTTLHATDTMQIAFGASARWTGAPISSNKTIDNQGTITGNVECLNFSGNNPTGGAVTTGVDAKSPPESTVFDSYKNMATVIANPGTIQRKILAPESNPLGNLLTNTNGVYFIDASGGDLIIEDSRIEATLVVDCGASRTVYLKQSVFMRSARSDYPALIVRGNLVLEMKSGLKDLSEAVVSTNFNPLLVPYEGSSDLDTADVYPNEVRGLIHVIGSLTIKESPRIRGTILCEGTARIEGAPELIHVPSLITNPPVGYTSTWTLRIQPNSWIRIVQ